MLRVVHLDQIRRNFLAIRGQVPGSAGVMAVVKADAYGHGLVQVAKVCLEAGAAMLAVAVPEEGALLREAGVTAPILVLGAATPDGAALGVRSGLTLTVCTPAMVRSAADAARNCGRTAEVHIAIDSGMCRIGCRDENEVLAVWTACREAGVRLTGAFTHFCDADGEDLAFTREQFRRFEAMTKPLPAGILRHCANSAAIHRMPEAALDMVRAGISLYGYPPVPDAGIELKPCLDWTTEVTHVKTIAPGDTVSYGRTFTADRPMRVATVACGYGDGYHRAASGRAEVIIRGRRVPVIGRICMDQMMADVSAVPDTQPGDRVTLLGRDGEAAVDAEDLARWAGTISYEVLLAPTGRVRRLWTDEGSSADEIRY